MAEYLRKIKLPSKGLLNADEPAFAGEIDIDMMGFAEEKMVFGSSSDTVIDKVLNKLIKTPGITCDKLSPNDKFYVLMQERIHSYGNKYRVNVTCPHCGIVSDIDIDLENVPVIELADDFKEPIVVKLPIKGDEVGLRLLRAKDLSLIDAEVKLWKEKFHANPAEVRYTTSLARAFMTVNGEPIAYDNAKNYLADLKGRDLSKIDRALNKYKFGYSDTFDSECPSCGGTIAVPLQITSEFFRPSNDDE